MFEFMTHTVFMTQFIFIVMLDAFLFIRAICWLWGKLKERKKVRQNGK